MMGSEIIRSISPHIIESVSSSATGAAIAHTYNRVK